LILSGLCVVVQASVLKCLPFNQLPFLQDLFGSTKVSIRWCDVAKALVVALIVVVISEQTDL